MSVNMQKCAGIRSSAKNVGEKGTQPRRRTVHRAGGQKITFHQFPRRTTDRPLPCQKWRISAIHYV